MNYIARIVTVVSFLLLTNSVVDGINNSYPWISITIAESKGTNTPRMPMNVPIECSYNNGTLDFSFYENLGEVEIIITSVASGSIETTVVDTSIGHTIIGVPTIPGNYEILIETPITSYYGCYSL